LDVNSLLKDKSGAMIKFDYRGVIQLTLPTAAALAGAKEAKTTDFGDAREYCPTFLSRGDENGIRRGNGNANGGEIVTHVTFETGSDEFRALEQKIYVASGRFVIEEGRPLVVEYKISEVTA
jgi:hypothetical protein